MQVLENVSEAVRQDEGIESDGGESYFQVSYCYSSL